MGCVNPKDKNVHKPPQTNDSSKKAQTNEKLDDPIKKPYPNITTTQQEKIDETIQIKQEQIVQQQIVEDQKVEKQNVQESVHQKIQEVAQEKVAEQIQQNVEQKQQQVVENQNEQVNKVEVAEIQQEEQKQVKDEVQPDIKIEEQQKDNSDNSTQYQYNQFQNNLTVQDLCQKHFKFIQEYNQNKDQYKNDFQIDGKNNYGSLQLAN